MLRRLRRQGRSPGTRHASMRTQVGGCHHVPCAVSLQTRLCKGCAQIAQCCAGLRTHALFHKKTSHAQRAEHSVAEEMRQSFLCSCASLTSGKVGGGLSPRVLLHISFIFKGGSIKVDISIFFDNFDNFETVDNVDNGRYSRTILDCNTPQAPSTSILFAGANKMS